jgi:CubicO group peptidase (beta-lactamase class C family)
MTGNRLVHRIVDDFGEQMVHRLVVGAADIHARAAAHGLQPFQHLDMYGASLTKAAFAYMLLQLVDEGKLDLDAPLERLLPKPLPEYKSPTTTPTSPATIAGASSPRASC